MHEKDNGTDTRSMATLSQFRTLIVPTSFLDFPISGVDFHFSESEPIFKIPDSFTSYNGSECPPPELKSMERSVPGKGR